MVKVSSSSAGVQVGYLIGELGFHVPPGQKHQIMKQKQNCNKFNNDFKNGPHCIGFATHQYYKVKKKKKSMFLKKEIRVEINEIESIKTTEKLDNSEVGRLP